MRFVNVYVNSHAVLLSRQLKMTKILGDGYGKDARLAIGSGYWSESFNPYPSTLPKLAS
jgi:hypothetical protein